MDSLTLSVNVFKDDFRISLEPALIVLGELFGQLYPRVVLGTVY